MEIKKYFLLGLGDLNSLTKIKDDLERISNDGVKYIISKGIIMFRFESVFTPNEVKSFICDEEDKTFFMYEIDDNSSAQNIAMDGYNEHLFSEVKEKVSLSNNSSLSGSTIDNNISEIDRIKIIDDLIDKGLDNLTDEDKNLLKKLS